MATRSTGRSWRLATALVCIVAATSTASAIPATASTASYGRIAGMGVSPPNRPLLLTVADLDRVKRIGVDHVAIDVWWDFDLREANIVHPGAITTPDAVLRLAVNAAREQGLRVILTPKLWCVPCLVGGFTWRGRLEPADRTAFFRSYRVMVNRYARLAARLGIDIFFIGSELSLLESSTAEWRRVANEARARFPGPLAYNANWDALNEVDFWDSLDIVGVSAYFPLSKAERPSVAQLERAWHLPRGGPSRGSSWFDQLVRLAARASKPVLFAEVGYLSSTYGAEVPYNPSRVFEPDQSVQANAYEALLRTFENQPWWLGAVWWEWERGLEGDRDLGYSPRAKLAEGVLTSWYANGSSAPSDLSIGP